MFLCRQNVGSLVSWRSGIGAAKMAEQVPGKVKNARHAKAMATQQRIALEIARSKVGQELKLLVDQPLAARTEADAPDVDARVVLSEAAPVGEFIRCHITGSRGYDLIA